MTRVDLRKSKPVRDTQRSSFSKCVINSESMAGVLAKRCISPLALVNRRLSAPEFRVRAGYHEKVRFPITHGAFCVDDNDSERCLPPTWL